MSGVACPACGETARAVLESRRLADRVRRRCCCSACGERFTTLELRQDQITAQANRAAAARASRLLSRFHQLEQATATLRKLLDDELSAPDAPDLQALDATCEDCRHWAGRCGLGFPDPLEESLAFARECSSFMEVTA
jgi:hypothetical protein